MSDDFFDQAADFGTAGNRGKFINVDGNFLIESQILKSGKGEIDGLKYFVHEFEIVESSVPDEIKPGTICVEIRKFGPSRYKSEMSFKKLNSLVEVLIEEDWEVMDAEQRKDALKANVEAGEGTGGENVGKLLRLRTNNSPTEAGGVFTHYNYSPATVEDYERQEA